MNPKQMFIWTSPPSRAPTPVNRAGQRPFFGSEGPSTAQPTLKQRSSPPPEPPRCTPLLGCLGFPPQRGELGVGAPPPRQSGTLGRYPGAARAAGSLGDLPSARALLKQRGCSPFCSGDPRRSGSGQGQWDVEVKGRGRPACPHTGPSRGTGSTGKHTRVPPPASLPARGRLQPGPPVGELRHPARGCSHGPFPTGQLILA